MTLPRPGALPAEPPVASLQSGDRLVRIYDPRHLSWRERRHWGPLPDVRFDHHSPPLGHHPERSVWYAAHALVGAVAEAYGKRGFIDRGSSDRIVVCRVVSPTPILLVDLLGVAARRFGLTQEIAASTDYDACQEWARALYERYDRTCGLRWRGRITGSICVALNDRAPMSRLRAEQDLPITNPAAWPRVTRAARRCAIRVV